MQLPQLLNSGFAHDYGDNYTAFATQTTPPTRTATLDRSDGCFTDAQVEASLFDKLDHFVDSRCGRDRSTACLGRRNTSRSTTYRRRCPACSLGHA